MKKAIVSGLTGQDGSYLAENLLDKGYEVYGIVRRVSTPNYKNIQHLLEEPNLHLEEGDITDLASLIRLFKRIQPDEIYNLAAQSYVAISWNQPLLTSNTTGIGALNVFEAARQVCPKAKIYQASSSEMFDGVEYPQTETTKFKPRSPYGVSKLFAHEMARIYKESYGMFISCGILFNHETEVEFTPVFIKEKDSYEFDIKPLSDVIQFDKTKKEYQEKEVLGLQIWDKDGWVDITYASAYPHDIENDNKNPRMINSRMGINAATGSHVVFMEDGSEKETKDIVTGDKIEKISLPKAEWEMATAKIPNLCDEAEMLGMLVGDGYVPSNGNGAKFINSDEKLRNRFTELWGKVAGGKVNYYPSKSGFNPENTVGYLGLSGNNSYLRSLDLYTSDRKKRVPKKVLNASPQVQLAFLRGYNATDGLKKNKCTYEFKNFKTNSATLAMGLIYLIECTTKQKYNLTVEKPEKPWYHIYYSINLLSPTNNLEKEKQVKGLIEQGVGQRAINRITGISRAFVRKIQNGGVACIEHHMEQDDCEVKKIIEMPDYDGWFYDLTTTSGAFHAGIGKCHVHNSPRRGIEFVTQKIVDSVVKQMCGDDSILELGNMEAKRDWSHAEDMVQGMWLMLQNKEPDNYILASGETHSVFEFVNLVYGYFNMDVIWLTDHNTGLPIGVDTEGNILVRSVEKYYRPNEVHILLGDSTRARKELLWTPEFTFNMLVTDMVAAKLQEYSN